MVATFQCLNPGKVEKVGHKAKKTVSSLKINKEKDKTLAAVSEWGFGGGGLGRGKNLDPGVESEEEEEEEEDDLVFLSGCSEQTRSGPVRVGVSRPNEAGRDFHLRLCEQETSGGGWTVGRSMSSSVLVLALSPLLTCMLLSLGQIRA